MFVLEELPEEGGKRIGRLHRGCLWTKPPTKGRRSAIKERSEKASTGYKMRRLTLELWQKWSKIRLHLRRPELSLEGTNNASERAIGKSKVRYKSMRGYKSMEGMSNGVVLTQWLYSGEDSLVRSRANTIGHTSIGSTHMLRAGTCPRSHSHRMTTTSVPSGRTSGARLIITS